MPRFFCDYCDVYLTHDSLNVRRSHNAGWKHKANVRAYYAQFLQTGQVQGLNPMMGFRAPNFQQGLQTNMVQNTQIVQPGQQQFLQGQQMMQVQPQQIFDLHHPQIKQEHN